MTYKELICEIKNDLNSEGIIDVRLFMSSFLYNPSFRLLLNYRIGRYLSSSKWKFTRFLSNYNRMRQITKRSCQISFKVAIGKGIKFVHPLGIVISDGVVIKDNVTIWQEVTLGSHGKVGIKLNYPITEKGKKFLWSKCSCF